MSISRLKRGARIDNPVDEFQGLSTDTKPTYAPNGSSFFEMDTFKIYFFDKDSGTWITKGANAND